MPLVYDDLHASWRRKGWPKRLPARHFKPPALVHEAYVRLVDQEKAQDWHSRRHFFAAAAEGHTGCILVENARRKHRLKHGGDCVRQAQANDIACPEKPERLIALDEALDRLATTNSQAAELVKLRYFAGFSNAEAASFLAISPRKANQVWAYARAWLREELGDEEK